MCHLCFEVFQDKDDLSKHNDSAHQTEHSDDIKKSAKDSGAPGVIICLGIPDFSPRFLNSSPSKAFFIYQFFTHFLLLGNWTRFHWQIAIFFFNQIDRCRIAIWMIEMVLRFNSGLLNLLDTLIDDIMTWQLVEKNLKKI